MVPSITDSVTNIMIKKQNKIKKRPKTARNKKNYQVHDFNLLTPGDASSKTKLSPSFTSFGTGHA